MSFKIWGKSEMLDEAKLKHYLETMGRTDAMKVIQNIIKEGFMVIGGSKILLLKFK